MGQNERGGGKSRCRVIAEPKVRRRARASTARWWGLEEAKPKRGGRRAGTGWEVLWYSPDERALDREVHHPQAGCAPQARLRVMIPEPRGRGEKARSAHRTRGGRPPLRGVRIPGPPQFPLRQSDGVYVACAGRRSTATPPTGDPLKPRRTPFPKNSAPQGFQWGHGPCTEFLSTIIGSVPFGQTRRGSRGRGCCRAPRDSQKCRFERDESTNLQQPTGRRKHSPTCATMEAIP